jgi:hypothetical protein
MGFLKIIVYVGVFVIMFGTLQLLFGRAYDDTDDASTRTRSGMVLYIDHGTRCQYVAAGTFGAITPRLKADGTQVCE